MNHQAASYIGKGKPEKIKKWLDFTTDLGYCKVTLNNLDLDWIRFGLDLDSQSASVVWIQNPPNRGGLRKDVDLTQMISLKCERNESEFELEMAWMFTACFVQNAECSHRIFYPKSRVRPV